MLGNTSGGCEPLYNVAYLKNVSQDIQGDEELVEFDDYFLRTLKANNVDVEEVKDEAREKMQSGEFEAPRSLDTVPDEISSLFVTSGELSAKEHASVQCAFQDGVDSAISKTVNFPEDATKEDVKEVYEYIYDNDGKGVTVYVEGSRNKAVLSTSSNKADEGADEADDDISGSSDEPDEDTVVIGDVETTEARPRERPKRLRGTMYPIPTGYGELNVTVNEDENGDPLEIWAEIGKSGGFTHSLTEAVGRLGSVALRAGVPRDVIVEQLEGIRSPKVAWHDQKQIHSIPDAIACALKQHADGQTHPSEDNGVRPEAEKIETETPIDDPSLIDGCPECSGQVNYKEGCQSCKACGWSKC
jgi:ribonucleoside-diphosphate reductase alpha chain